jgi:hypothetical protein
MKPTCRETMRTVIVVRGTRAHSSQRSLLLLFSATEDANFPEPLARQAPNEAKHDERGDHDPDGKCETSLPCLGSCRDGTSSPPPRSIFPTWHLNADGREYFFIPTVASWSKGSLPLCRRGAARSLSNADLAYMRNRRREQRVASQ